jgi:hypothetical protein
LIKTLFLFKNGSYSGLSLVHGCTLCVVWSWLWFRSRFCTHGWVFIARPHGGDTTNRSGDKHPTVSDQGGAIPIALSKTLS